MSEPIIIGIDPGSRALGFGIIQVRDFELHALHWGVIRPKAKDLPTRLFAIGLELQNIFSTYRPQYVAIEKVFLGRNVDSAFVLGHARGVALAQAGRVQAKVAEYAARSVKKAVTGKGGADKEHVRKVVEALLQIQVAELDATDALSMAIAHTRELEKQMKIQGQQGVDL